MSNTIGQNINTGNSINTGSGGGTIGSSLKPDGLGVKISSAADYKPTIAVNVEQQAEQAYAAGEARESIANQLYGQSRAAREGYGGKIFDPAKTKAIQRGLTTIKSRTPPEGLNQSLSAGIFSGSVEDFNEYILGESQRGIREQVNLYLDYQNFSPAFREKYRISPDRDGKLDLNDVWQPEIQREGQKDLIRQRERGLDQVDSVFRGNNPRYVEDEADKRLERQYRDLRESGLSPHEAGSRLQPQLSTNYDGRHYWGNEWTSVSDTVDRAKNPQAYISHYENKYQDFAKKVNSPLNIDFSQSPIYIPYAHPMQAEWNRQNYEAMKAERRLQENPNDAAAKLTGSTGIISPQAQQQMAEKYGYNSWRDLATAHFDFKEHQAALPKFSDTDKNVYFDGGGNPYVTNAKALTAAGGGTLTVDFVGNNPLSVSGANNMIGLNAGSGIVTADKQGGSQSEFQFIVPDGQNYKFDPNAGLMAYSSIATEKGGKTTDWIPVKTYGIPFVSHSGEGSSKSEKNFAKQHEISIRNQKWYDEDYSNPNVKFIDPVTGASRGYLGQNASPTAVQDKYLVFATGKKLNYDYLNESSWTNTPDSEKLFGFGFTDNVIYSDRILDRGEIDRVIKNLESKGAGTKNELLVTGIPPKVDIFANLKVKNPNGMIGVNQDRENYQNQYVPKNVTYNMVSDTRGDVKKFSDNVNSLVTGGNFEKDGDIKAFSDNIGLFSGKVGDSGILNIGAAVFTGAASAFTAPAQNFFKWEEEQAKAAREYQSKYPDSVSAQMRVRDHPLMDIGAATLGGITGMAAASKMGGLVGKTTGSTTINAGRTGIGGSAISTGGKVAESVSPDTGTLLKAGVALGGAGMIKTGVEKLNWNDYSNSINLPVANDPKQTIYLPTYDFGIEPPTVKLLVREYPKYELPGAGWDRSGNAPIVKLPTSQNGIFNDVPAGSLLYKLPSVVTGKSDLNQTIVGNGGLTIGGYKYDLQPEGMQKRVTSQIIKERYDPDRDPLFNMDSLLLPYEKAMKYKYDPFNTKGYNYAYEIERNKYSGKTKVKEMAYRLESSYTHKIDMDYAPKQETQRKRHTLEPIPAVIMPELRDIKFDVDNKPVKKRKTETEGIPAFVLPPDMDFGFNKNDKPSKKTESFVSSIPRTKTITKNTASGIGGMVMVEKPKTAQKLIVFPETKIILEEQVKQKQRQVEQQYAISERNRQKLISNELEKTGIVGELEKQVEISQPLTRTRTQNKTMSSGMVLENVFEQPITRARNASKNTALEVGGLLGTVELNENAARTKTRQLTRTVGLQATDMVLDNPMWNVSPYATRTHNMNPNVFGYPYIPEPRIPPRSKKLMDTDDRNNIWGFKRIKAVKVYHREIKDPLETLGVGSMTNPYTKSEYKYGGSLDLTFKNGTLAKTKNTLKKPKLPKNRTVVYGGEIETLIVTETKRQKTRAAAKKKGKTISRRTSPLQKMKKSQTKQPQFKKLVFGSRGRKNNKKGGRKNSLF